MDKKYLSREIRRMILEILHEARKAALTESGGYLNHLMLQELMSVQGYDLSTEDLKDYCIYLFDNEIGCIDMVKLGKTPPYVYKYRITAKGVRVLEGDEIIKGIR
jgi:hypothetical protein